MAPAIHRPTRDPGPGRVAGIEPTKFGWYSFSPARVMPAKCLTRLFRASGRGRHTFSNIARLRSARCSRHVPGMGLPRVRSLHDLHRHDADLRVRCLRCRHVAIFDAARIIAYFHSRGWNMAWELVPTHFRCSGCSVKQVDVGLAPKAKRLPIPVPEPVRMQEPSRREVNEHIRRTRG